MARDFDGSDDYLSRTDSLVTAAPFTLAVWAKPHVAGDGNDRTALLLSESSPADFADNAVYLKIDSSNVAQILVAAGSAANADAGTITHDVWNHIACVSANNSSRFAFLAGVKGTEDTTEISIASIIRAQVGAAFYGGSAQDLFQGDLAEAGFWNVVLDDQEIAALAAGYSPRMVRPQSLMANPALLNRTTTGHDIVAGTWTTNSAPAVSTHPRVIYPAQPGIFVPAAVAGGASIMNQMQNSNLGSDLYNGALQ